MERESLLSILIVLLGGLALQLLGGLTLHLLGRRPPAAPENPTSVELERTSWRRLWYPIMPTLVVATWLCGWALRSPDPVRDRLDPWVLLATSVPFAFVLVRALTRAAWALLRSPIDCGILTVGLLQPQVVFSPFLAKQLEDSVIHAALAHERAHANHRDPLRIWLAQLITDLQWPWPRAVGRLDAWLEALELARDDEARAEGTDGADLAAAILASVRYFERVAPPLPRMGLTGDQLAHARLIGDPAALRLRVSRLLGSPPQRTRAAAARSARIQRAGMTVLALLLIALVLGAVYGERILHPLLGMTS